MKFEHDTVLQEYGVDRKPDIRQFHKLPGIHKEPLFFLNKILQIFIFEVDLFNSHLISEGHIPRRLRRATQRTHFIPRCLRRGS